MGNAQAAATAARWFSERSARKPAHEGPWHLLSRNEGAFLVPRLQQKPEDWDQAPLQEICHRRQLAVSAAPVQVASQCCSPAQCLGVPTNPPSPQQDRSSVALWVVRLCYSARS